MEEEEAAAPTTTSLVDAVCGGAGAQAIREMVWRMPQEEVDAMDELGRTALVQAVSREVDVLKVVLEATSQDGILKHGEREEDALAHALVQGEREAAVMIAEKILGGGEWKPYSIDRGSYTWVNALFNGTLVGDRQVVDLVAKLVPDSYFDPPGGEDMFACLMYADGDISYAVKVCLERGPSMEERIGGRFYLRYVACCSSHRSVEDVKMIYGLVPKMADGSVRRAPVKDYADVIMSAALNHEYSLEIMKFVVEECGVEALEACPPEILTRVDTKEEVEWPLAQCPCLMTKACEEVDYQPFIFEVLYLGKEMADFLLKTMVELVDRQVIVTSLRAIVVPVQHSKASDGWMWHLEPIDGALREACEGRVWTCLLWAVDCQRYRNVEYLLDLCTRGDLVRQGCARTKTM